MFAISLIQKGRELLNQGIEVAMSVPNPLAEIQATPEFEEQCIYYGQTAFVLYQVSDGRRWTYAMEKEYTISGDDYYFARTTKRPEPERLDMIFIRVVGQTVWNSKDLRVQYNDKVLIWGWIGAGRYLRPSRVVGWLQFGQEVPDVGTTGSGENVFRILSPNNKEGPVKFGDAIIIESACYPGWKVLTVYMPSGRHLAMGFSGDHYVLGWSPQNGARACGILPPFQGPTKGHPPAHVDTVRERHVIERRARERKEVQDRVSHSIEDFELKKAKDLPLFATNAVSNPEYADLDKIPSRAAPKPPGLPHGRAISAHSYSNMLAASLASNTSTTAQPGYPSSMGSCSKSRTPELRPAIDTSKCIDQFQATAKRPSQSPYNK